MDILDAINEQIRISPYLSGALIAEYSEASLFKGVSPREIIAYITGIFDETYFNWKLSEEPDIKKFFLQKAVEMKKQGDLEHSNLLMTLLNERLKDESYFQEIEIERLRDKMIISCDQKKFFSYRIDWPLRKENVLNFLESFGWIKISCHGKNPMTRIRKPRRIKKIMKKNTNTILWNPITNMWAVIDQTTLVIC